MRWRSLIWLFVSVACLCGALYFWQLGNQWSNRAGGAGTEKGRVAATRGPSGLSLTGGQPVRLLTGPGNLNAPKPEARAKKALDSRLAFRLSNTTRTMKELVRSDSALLLENALIDTANPAELAIPSHLKAQGDPGSYIVQSRGVTTPAFREKIAQAGATIVSYIPNNAFLVRASADAAKQLAADAGTLAVVAYEPFFKLKPSLLKLAAQNQPLPEGSELNLLLFPGTRDAAVGQLQKLTSSLTGPAVVSKGSSVLEVVSEDQTPFGPMLKVRVPVDSLPKLAAMSVVQSIEWSRRRVPANDVSRTTIGVSSDSIVSTNYLGLTGEKVLVGVTDTGVDTNHPGLVGRVSFDVPTSGVDSNGHGTHVAGIIAGNGTNSLTVSNALGSLMPPTEGQFRGMAPAAKLFSMSSDLIFGPGSDTYLQETASRTNAFISNNSWHYEFDSEYDLAAASYDAAVRDAQPGVTGSQPLLLVFSAGNSGGGDDVGQGGEPETIHSPGTAKNVITVGTVEQLRGITNEVINHCVTSDVVTNTADATNVTVTVTVCDTNTPWAGSTDSTNEIASFSSRGNVGVGIEGEFGRFKPDVVAPGTFIISARSTTWDEGAYYNPTNYHYNFYTDEEVAQGAMNLYGIWVPINAVAVDIWTRPTVKNPSLDQFAIYVRQPDAPTTNTYDFVRTNHVSMPPDGGANLNPRDAAWFYGVGTSYTQAVAYNITERITTTNDNGNYFQVLSNMNCQLGSCYRYESGSSMSAASVSGTLALMQEFFEQRLHVTNSPALMKALLINGARSAGRIYSLYPKTEMNFQGWGKVSLPNSLQGSLSNRNLKASSMLAFDQSPTNALATGESFTFKVKVDYKALTTPLRFTLVWTDPPGNPVASTKLVNDLDLVVTNLDSGDVFYGNDIYTGNDFNLAWDTNSVPNRDVVNNVENVYLPPIVGTNYSVTVRGARVNVNAVTGHTNDVVQDYALVVSSGNGDVVDALTLVSVDPLVTLIEPLVTIITNSMPQGGAHKVTGGVLNQQRVGAHAPILGTNTALLDMPTNAVLTIGMTNQWHFYAITNEGSFTNAAFGTFFPPTLSLPRVGVREPTKANSTRTESDIDLYVSQDAGLTNLDGAVLGSAFKSLGRDGTETIVLTNAEPGVYYIGVKSESQLAGEYGLLSVFSEEPFSKDGALLTFPNPVEIPDGTTAKPGGVQIFGIQPEGYLVRRVMVTNILSHEMMGDLMGNLNHSGKSAWLNNHSPESAVTNRMYIYDDSDEKDHEGSIRSDGPGHLTEFGGAKGQGQWIFTQFDSALTHRGTNELLNIYLEKQEDLEKGFLATINGHSCREDFLYVAPEATNLTVRVRMEEGDGPVSVQVCRQGDITCHSILITGITSSNDYTVLIINGTTDPPLNAGMYVIRMCNQGGAQAKVFVQATIEYDYSGLIPVKFTSTEPVPILDDAVTYSTITIPNKDRLISVEAGIRVDHPRVSDLAFTLISPTGTRVLLQENRGGDSASQMGGDMFATNIIPVSSSGGAAASTNTVNTGLIAGNLTIDWTFYSIPDRMVVYYESNVLFDTGMVSGNGTTNLTFGPGASTFLTVVMNPGNNPDQNTAWDYTLTSTMAEYLYTIFTEDTNKTLMPIKFAEVPYTNANYIGTNLLFTNGIYYLPEESLAKLQAEQAQGDWRLEIEDRRVGALAPKPNLISWELLMRFENPVPAPTVVSAGTAMTNTVGPGQIKYLIVNVPDWASFSTNMLITATGDLNLWFNQTARPTGTNAGDVFLFGPKTSDVYTLNTSAAPILIPGTFYYLGVENTNATSVTFVLQVDFNMTPLTNGLPIATTMAAGDPPRYFYYDAAADETAMSFTLDGLSADGSLVLRKGIPFPTPQDYTYGSFNPGLGREEIIVTTNSDPVVLSAGRWYLGVYKVNGGGMDYTILATAYTNPIPTIVTLYSGVPYSTVNPGGTQTNDYYRFVVSPKAARLQFDVLNPTENVVLVARKGLLPPDLGSYQYLSDNTGFRVGPVDEMIVVYDFTQPVPVAPGDWFLTVVNLFGDPVSYSVKATEWQVYGTNFGIVGQTVQGDLASGTFQLCLTWLSEPGMRYYIEGKADLQSLNWRPVTPTLTAVDQTLSYCFNPIGTGCTIFRVRQGLAPLPPFPAVKPPETNPRLAAPAPVR